jgi:hypothetical protein
VKPRRAIVKISDHALLRFLERQHGVDIEAIRRGMAAGLEPVAALGAAELSVGKVKLLLKTIAKYDDGTPVMMCVTVLKRGTAGVGDHLNEDGAADA